MASVHDLLMYLGEGELGFREMIGITAVASMVIAALVGIILSKKKTPNLYVPSTLRFSSLLLF
ncbi:hypothetical protein EJF36_07050 [Bacillus sp. HMF5848]|uniref:hypothetical protein n=1 Tax=Bacillus sp. HMF5848 TaxID=2495421 RepID=UPI000F77A4E4|nr:hypothetical protein [Bacillus sp. HMF5848]RSK26635.1 hypothetical protein EJF36_07050 [Bacillus sp. HMF5848]